MHVGAEYSAPRICQKRRIFENFMNSTNFWPSRANLTQDIDSPSKITLNCVFWEIKNFLWGKNFLPGSHSSELPTTAARPYGWFWAKNRNFQKCSKVCNSHIFACLNAFQGCRSISGYRLRLGYSHIQGISPRKRGKFDARAPRRGKCGSVPFRSAPLRSINTFGD